ncbi:response regulator transcription factor [Nocardia tengchongensis]|uniref:Response regulator transcription factor n=1 Tax=Nocardia tengchongensis TaxID=2055889 RepID=A0ABX8CHJ7_9NOCA|nr:response regulator transcription factor [Nocardia tengchongensis]QVI19431.1 response regulator transcription factor [Nocardia tengchongensis]
MTTQSPPVRPPLSRRHPVRVVLIDSDRSVRAAVADLLEVDPAVSVVGEADTLDRALTLVAGTKPDVAVIDPRLPDGDGLDICRTLRAGGAVTRFLILTADIEPGAMLAAVDAGAAGYILKDLSELALADAVKAIAAGQSRLESHTAPMLMRQARGRGDHRPAAALTTTEMAVMLLLADGLTDQQIAKRLVLTGATVHGYVTRLMRKFGLDDRGLLAAHTEQLRAPAPSTHGTN